MPRDAKRCERYLTTVFFPAKCHGHDDVSRPPPARARLAHGPPPCAQGGGGVCSQPEPGVAAGPGGQRRRADAAEKVHAEVWRRFIDEHDILIDYADTDGSFPRPTAEECREQKPNALGWWTPIENGSMFNGMYLDAAVHRWKISRAEADKEHARRMADALLMLSSLGPPGFIARGVADDGKTPYPMGSNDQTAPWFYGLWKYLPRRTCHV